MNEVKISSFTLKSPSRPSSQTIRFLVIARIIGPVGVDGVVRARLLTDFPEHFSQLTAVHVGDNLRSYRIESVRLDGTTVDLKLAGIEDATAARALRDHEIQIPIDQAMPLSPDHYYWHQIIDLRVYSDGGRDLGKVTDVLRTGSNDVYVVGHGRNELLIPAIEDVVVSIDLPGGTMIVHLIPGLDDQAEQSAETNLPGTRNPG
jgi:16S rRNA processing protein RimM